MNIKDSMSSSHLFSYFALLLALTSVSIAGPMDLLLERTAHIVQGQKRVELERLNERFVVKANAINGVRPSAGLDSVEFLLVGNRARINHALLLFHSRSPRHLGRFCLGTDKKPTSDRTEIEKTLKSRNEGAIILSIKSNPGCWPGFSGHNKGKNGASLLAICDYSKRFNLHGKLKFHLGAFGAGYRPLYSLFCLMRVPSARSKHFLEEELATVTDHDGCYTSKMMCAYRWLIKSTQKTQVNFIHYGRPTFEMHRKLACRFNNLTGRNQLPTFGTKVERSCLAGRLRFWSSKSFVRTLGGQLARAFFGYTREILQLCQTSNNLSNGLTEGEIIKEEQILRVDRKPL